MMGRIGERERVDRARARLAQLRGEHCEGPPGVDHGERLSEA